MILTPGGTTKRGPAPRATRRTVFALPKPAPPPTGHTSSSPSSTRAVVPPLLQPLLRTYFLLEAFCHSPHPVLITSPTSLLLQHRYSHLPWISLALFSQLESTGLFCTERCLAPSLSSFPTGPGNECGPPGPLGVGLGGLCLWVYGWPALAVRSTRPSDLAKGCEQPLYSGQR